MDCWHILQLTPTSDIRTIKKAYAALLKNNRPDDDPAAFRQLHDAYQEALGKAEEQLELEATQAAGSQQEAVDDTGYGCGNPDCEHCAAHAVWEQQLDEQWEILVQKTEDILNQNDLRNDPAAWQFLNASEALLDIDFKAAFAMRFLQRLLQIFSEQREQGTPLLQPAIVTHLNQLFWWSERRHHYDGYIDPDLLDDFMQWWQPTSGNAAAENSLFPFEAPPQTPAIPPSALTKIQASLPSRFLASLLDLCMLLLLSNWIFSALKIPDPGLVGYLLLYALVSALFEMSPLQATPGKWLYKLKVYDSRQQRMRPLWALQRALLFAFSAWFLFAALIINLLVWDGRLAHDRFSRSLVLKR